MNDKPSGGGLKKACLGCLSIILLGALLLGILNISGSSSLDARFEQVKSEVKERRANEAKPRPLLIQGMTAEDGNAALYYRGLEWAFGESVIHRYEKNPPALPEGTMEDRAKLLDRKYDFLLQKELEEHMNGGKEPSAEALEQYKAYSATLHYMRKGLRQNVCNWEVEYERAYSAAIPNLIVFRATAVLAAYEAFLSKDPAKALRIGQELLAFGDDIALNPSLICGMISIAVESIAIKSLERTLRTHSYDTVGYQVVLQMLDKLPEHNMDEYTGTETLSFDIQILNMSGRRLDPNYDASEVQSEDKVFASMGSYFINRELEGMDEFMGKRATEIMAKPYKARQDGAAQFEEEVRSSSYLLVRIAVPNIIKAQDNFDVLHAERRMLRVLLAAHMERAMRGSFPSDPAVLKTHLGGELPADPLHPELAPISYKLDGETLRIYSWGEDMVDDGGAREEGRAMLRPKGEPALGDIVLLGSAPK